jgi:ribosomal protein L44E
MEKSMEYCPKCKENKKHKNRGFLFVLFYPTSKLFMKKRCVDCNTKLILKN